jgi:hypothetical protein
MVRSLCGAVPFSRGHCPAVAKDFYPLPPLSRYLKKSRRRDETRADVVRDVQRSSICPSLIHGSFAAGDVLFPRRGVFSGPSPAGCDESITLWECVCATTECPVVFGKVEQASIANRRTTRCRAVPASHPTYAMPAFLRHFPLTCSRRLTLSEAASDAVQSDHRQGGYEERGDYWNPRCSRPRHPQDLVLAVDAVTPERAVNHKTTFLGGISHPHKAELFRFVPGRDGALGAGGRSARGGAGGDRCGSAP